MADFSYVVGVDHREPDAHVVAIESARAYSSKPLHVIELEHLDLRRRQLFHREWRINADGSYMDCLDGRPFSVQFSHSRFLAPLLAIEEGHTGWCCWSDGDWLWASDIHGMLKEADSSKTCMVVPHRFAPEAKVKMDGMPQAIYGKKLHSALILWNLASKKLPTVEMINNATGRDLHQFAWLNESDIGHLSESWHWIPNYSPTTEAAQQAEANNKPVPINGIHFTFGIPDPKMYDREATPWDQTWRDELITATRNRF